MPDILEPPTPVALAGETDHDSLMSEFDKAGADNPTETERNDPRGDPKPEKQAAKAETPKDDSIVPDEFLTGKKADAPEVKEPEVVDEVPANAAPKQLREALARREAKLKELSVKVADYERKLAERPEGAPSKEQEEAYHAAQEQVANLKELVERSAFERSEKYQKFGKREEAVIKDAQAYFEGTDVPPAVIEIASRMRGQARLKALRDSGLDSDAIGSIEHRLSKIDDIRGERDASLENWKQEAMAQQEQTKQEQMAQEARIKARDNAVFERKGAEMATKLEGFTRIPGNEKHNAEVEENIREAKSFFDGTKTLDELAEMGFVAVAAGMTNKINKGLKAKVDALTEENSRLKAAQPGTGHAADAKAGERPMTDKESYAAAFEAAGALVGR